MLIVMSRDLSGPAPARTVSGCERAPREPPAPEDESRENEISSPPTARVERRALSVAKSEFEYTAWRVA